MPEAKVKEPTLRERMVTAVGGVLMEGFGLGEIPVTKEGFLLSLDGKHFVVKVIQKKNPVPQGDVKELFTAVEADAESAEDAEEVEMEDYETDSFASEAI